MTRSPDSVFLRTDPVITQHNYTLAKIACCSRPNACADLRIQLSSVKLPTEEIFKKCINKTMLSFHWISFCCGSDTFFNKNMFLCWFIIHIAYFKNLFKIYLIFNMVNINAYNPHKQIYKSIWWWRWGEVLSTMSVKGFWHPHCREPPKVGVQHAGCPPFLLSFPSPDLCWLLLLVFLLL